MTTKPQALSAPHTKNSGTAQHVFVSMLRLLRTLCSKKPQLPPGRDMQEARSAVEWSRQQVTIYRQHFFGGR